MSLKKSLFFLLEVEKDDSGPFYRKTAPGRIPGDKRSMIDVVDADEADAQHRPQRRSNTQTTKPRPPWVGGRCDVEQRKRMPEADFWGLRPPAGRSSNVEISLDNSSLERATI